MKTILRQRAICVALASSLSLPLPVFAAGETAAVISGVVNWGTSWIGSQIAGMTNFLSDNFSKVGSAIQAEINKSAIAQKNVAEGIASYEAQERLRLAALDSQEKLQQPSNTCAAIATANAMPNADVNTRMEAFRSTTNTVAGGPRPLRNVDGSPSGRLADSITYASDTQRSIIESHEHTMKNYCTDEDAKRGRCRKNTSRPELAGADFQANFLFLGTDGRETYTPGQDIAVDAYINRVVNVMPPEMLRDPTWERTPQGKAYLELTRRYGAYLSLPAYSLNQIKANHIAQPGLGDATQTSQKTGRKDISMMEAIGEFVKSKFSAEAIKDLAVAMDPNKILRDMAQTNSYRLWIEYQQLRQAERTEATLAAMLALQAEQQLRAQVAAQSRAASAAR